MKYHRIWNFNAGPAAVPLEVLEKIHQSWFNYQGAGMAVLEMSHRSKEYDEIHNNTVARVKQLMGIGDDYHVLFLQGGASLQFAMIPMNFLTGGKKAEYLNTGSWATKAIKEAKLFGDIRVAFDGMDVDFTRLPGKDELDFREDAVYVHCTSNNTIKGTQFFDFPQTEIPLVCDMSSDILSRRFDPSPFGLIYAGAQKNLGPSGVTLVVISDEFHRKAEAEHLTTMLKYSTHIEKNSLFNTPNTFGIYFMGEVLQWMIEMGGLEAMEARNREKAELLYGFMDENPDFYRGTVEKANRSWMNVCMRLPEEELEKKFIAEGREVGFNGLKGHRSVGGIRVSMYNATPPEAIRELVEFMKQFMAKNG